MGCHDAGLAAGRISARLDRLLSNSTVWSMIGLLSLEFFVEPYDQLFTGYVAPGLVGGDIIMPITTKLLGSSGVAAALSALVLGRLFSQSSHVAEIVVLGISLTLANSIMTSGFHADRNELISGGVRARAVGFV